jgi:hypothetical protein
MQTQSYWYGRSINTTDFSVVKISVTDFPVVTVHIDDLSPARIWQHKMCATLSVDVSINHSLPIKAYYRICTVTHIRIEIIHGSQNVFWGYTWVGGYWYFIPSVSEGYNLLISCKPMLKLKTHSDFHDLFLKYTMIAFIWGEHRKLSTWEWLIYLWRVDNCFNL